MFDLLFPKHWSTLKKLIWLKAAALSSAVVKTVTAAIVHIRDALAGPAQNVTIAIEPAQSGSGDPSPDNVRPISGWTGANVYRAALYGLGPLENYGLSDNGSVNTFDTYEHSDYIDLTGVNSVSISFKGGSPGGWTYRVCGYDANKAFVELIDKKNLAGGNYSYTYDVTNYSFLRVSLVDNCENVVFTAEKETIPITFPTPPGTVYGGTLDVTTGVLTVTMASVDLGSIPWYVDGAEVGKFRSAFVNAIPILTGKWPAYTNNFICSAYKSVGIQSYSYQVNGTIYYSNGSVASPGANFIRIVDNAFANMSKEDFTAAVTGQTLVYELYEPQTYQLTPQEVQLLAGENNLWADTGNTTLTYLADGRASDTEALNILLGGAYHNSGGADEATDKEALDILLGGNR